MFDYACEQVHPRMLGLRPGMETLSSHLGMAPLKIERGLKRLGILLDDESGKVAQMAPCRPSLEVSQKKGDVAPSREPSGRGLLCPRPD